MFMTTRIYAAALMVVFATASSFSADEAKQKKSAKTESAADSPKKKSNKKTYAIIETNLGTFEVLLFTKRAPITTANFIGLAKGTKEWTDPKTRKKMKDKPYFDGLIFHRVIPKFMLQGGCPTGTGRSGPGFTIKDEFHPDLKHTKPGILSMANAGPNTGGSQFFVTVAKTQWLDGKHAVFGEVSKGMDVVMKISTVPTARGNRPMQDVIMKSVKIVERDAKAKKMKKAEAKKEEK